MLTAGPDEERPRAHRPPDVRELSLVLTTGCNLHCDYCYQGRRRARVMDWAVCRAALDRLVSAPGRQVGVTFTGGEPGLQFGLVRRAVEYLRARVDDTRVVRYHLVTNGLLLDADALAFLAAHRVKIDLSLHDARDAAAALPDGASTNADPERLEARLIGPLRTAHRAYFLQHLTVAVTVAAATIPYLADLIHRLLAQEVADIALQPAMGQREWSAGELAELDRQCDRIFRTSLDHYRATGSVPFARFRKPLGVRRPSRTRAWSCAAPLGRSLVVDVDGQVYPCPVLVPSGRAFQPARSEERVRTVSLGDVRDEELARRIDGLAAACRHSGLFAPTRLQHSGGRACRRCRCRADCRICPVARVWSHEVTDVQEVPRYLCAFNRTVARYRRRFPPQPPPGAATRLIIPS